MNRDDNINRKIKDTLKAMLSHIGSLILIVAACTAVISIILNWKTVTYEIGRLVKILMSFVFGIVFAFLINPMINSINHFLDRTAFKGKNKRLCKHISVALSYIIIFAFTIIVIVYIVPQISQSMKELTKSLGKGYYYLINHTDEIQKKYPLLPMKDISELVKNVVPENIFGYGTDLAKAIFPYLYNLSASFISGLINIIFAVVISYYVILDKEKIKKSIKRMIYVFVNEKNSSLIWNTFCECNRIFNGFLYGKSIDSLIIGILSLVVMSIIGLPYGLLLSLIVGITNMIPYFGPIIGAIPGVIIYLVIEPKYVIVYVVMIFVLQQFDGLYLGPKILGDLTGIKPLWVIFGITVGGAYFGPLGMFLGVPAVAVLMHVFNVIMDRKMKEKMIQKMKNKGEED